MTIRKENRNISTIVYNNRLISFIYRGSRLIYELITKALCCFSNGYWEDQYPWVDDEAWQD